MAVTARLYGLFFDSLASKKIDLKTDTLKVMLCTSAYTPNQDTHQYKSSVTNEVTGTGYTAGGSTLTAVTVTYDAATNKLKLDSADSSWAGATFTARYAVFYDSTPATDATRPLISYIDFGTDVVATAETLVIELDANGIAALTAA